MLPEFNPRISQEGGELRYQDGRVNGVVEADGECLTIRTWSSSFEGHGHTLQALQWLRSRGFTKITATGITLDIDEPERDAVSYWLHIQSLGLVEKLVDETGRLIGEIRPQAESEPEIDEFTIYRIFNGATARMGDMSVALSAPVAKPSSSSRASKRMASYSLLDSFSKGTLKTQREPLEDSDILYDLLNSDADRYGAVCKSIFAIHYNHSERAALNLIKHTRDVGLVSFDAGWDNPLTFLYNQATGQVMSSNGVQSLKDVSKGLPPKILSPKQAQERALEGGGYESDLGSFGYVAELILEWQAEILPR